MKKNNGLTVRFILIATYIYLCLPIIIFLLGWCRWYVGGPIALIACYSIYRCVKEYEYANAPNFNICRKHILKLGIALLIIMCWVWLSGIGKFVWQNEDHTCRNTIYELLVTQKWPLVGNYEVDGMMQERGMVYYIGFWLPAVLVGKVFGISAGYVVQYIWAVLGICIVYLLLCMWRKKILIWPLLIMILFSGLDIVGTLMASGEIQNIWGTEHIERWPGSYQFSGMTTQLFWVFNQAIPAWVASAIIFIDERPKNIIFVWSLIMITSTLPFIGLLPYVIYFMVYRSKWSHKQTVRELICDGINNFCSIQNILGGGCIGIISLLYLMCNISGGNTNLTDISLLSKNNLFQKICILTIALILFISIAYFLLTLLLRGYKKIIYILMKVITILGIVLLTFNTLNKIVGKDAQIHRLLLLILFYFLEAGIYLLCLYRKLDTKGLFWLNAIWLFLIPNIIVGSSIDFCMRASIPGLFLIIMWCIETLDKYKGQAIAWILAGILAAGSITSIHEIARTIVNTAQYQTIINESEEVIMTAGNFSGSTDHFFWKYIAR